MPPPEPPSPPAPPAPPPFATCVRTVYTGSSTYNFPSGPVGHCKLYQPVGYINPNEPRDVEMDYHTRPNPDMPYPSSKGGNPFSGAFRDASIGTQTRNTYVA